MTTPGTRSNESFAAGTGRAAGWALAAVLAGRAVSVLSLAVLARLLVPEDFGLLAFALVYLAFAETLADVGTNAAVIYWPARGGERHEVAQVSFAINIVLGLIWFAITIALAPALAGFFNRPETAPILAALAWAFPLRALGATHDALVQKDLRFRARLVPELGLAVAKGLCAIALALGGFGVWSLVWGHLAGIATWTVLLWIVVPWRPRASLPLRRVGPVLAYGRGMLAVNVIAAVVHHADLVVVGRMLGATALGFYQMAGRLPELSLVTIARVANRVLFPALARARADGESVPDACVTALRYVSLVVLPGAALLALLAEPIVAVVFGPAWAPAAPVLRLLAIYAGLRALGSFAGDVLKATGRPGLLAALGLLKAALVVPALIVAAPAGITAVAAALAATTVATLGLNLVVVSKVAGVRLAAVADAVRPAAVAAAPAIATVLVWLHAASGAAAWILALGGIASGAAVYLIALLLLERSAAIASAGLVAGGRR